MENSLTPANGPELATPQPLTLGKVAQVLSECFWNAVVLAFLARLFGGIVMGVVGGVWSHMIPSLPPGLQPTPKPEAEPPSGLDFSFFHHHTFLILFALFFLSQSIAQFARHSPRQSHRTTAALLQRLCGRACKDWFGLIVVNAFVAFVGVTVLEIVQQFALTQIFWHNVTGWIGHEIASVTPANAGFIGWIRSLVAWYDANHYKFLFWLFYSAALCDDLGLPNYKALSRYLWRRWHRATTPASLRQA